ncbi:MAG TPA: DUF697 domain-containing protein [Limnochordales bacterium]|nr:DUF697 domain-containing protein [Limnochordales bacterium]
MSSAVARMAAVAAAAALGLLVLFVINQTAQVVALADRLSPVLGSVVLWTLLAAYAGIGLYLGFQYARLPKPLRPPASKESPDYPRYLEALRSRLSRNPLVQGMPLETEADLEAAMAALGRKADEVTRATALQVFLMTAVSQNGILDALAVLAAQSRMVWQIAQIFHQRPTVRELAALYANVAAAALLSRQLEEMDLSDTLQPILSSAMPSAIGAVPGMEAAAIILVQSMMSGSANAYGTLRVGIIAKRYCGSLTMPGVAAVRKAAFVEAMKMIPSVVQDGTKAITGVIWESAAKAMRESVKRAGSAVVQTAGNVTERVAQGAREVAQGAREAASAGVGKVRDLGRLWPFRGRSSPAEDA